MDVTIYNECAESSPRWRQKLFISFDENKRPVLKTRDVLCEPDTLQPAVHEPTLPSPVNSTRNRSSSSRSSMRPRSTPCTSTTENESNNEIVQFFLDYTPLGTQLGSSSSTLSSSDTPIGAQGQDVATLQHIPISRARSPHTLQLNDTTSLSYPPCIKIEPQGPEKIKIEPQGPDKIISVRPDLDSNSEALQHSMVSRAHSHDERAQSIISTSSSSDPLHIPSCDIVTLDSDEESVTFVPQLSSRRQRAKRLAAQEAESLSPFLTNRVYPPSTKRSDVMDLTEYCAAEVKAAAESASTLSAIALSTAEPIELLPARIITKNSYYIARFDVPWCVSLLIMSSYSTSILIHMTCFILALPSLLTTN